MSNRVHLVLRILMGLWALSAIGHIFIGLFGDYERMSGRADFHLTGGIVQLVIAGAIFFALGKRDYT